MRSTGKARPAAALCLAGLVLSACSGNADLVEAFYERGDFAGAARQESAAARDPGKDRLLHLVEYATCALAAGNRAAARQAFVDAWGALGAERGSALRNFAALVAGESLKAYRGDPYERAMVSIYAGLLLFEAGDLENARAAFKNASLEDSGSADEEFNADFALAYFMEGLCAARLGDPGAQALFRRALRSRAGQRPTPFLRSAAESDANLLVVLGLGRGPRRVSMGVYDELAVFERVATEEAFAVVQVDGDAVGRTHEIEDLYYQAVTRGGRYMDDFLRTKAAIKFTLRASGGMLVGAGLVMAAAATNNDQRQAAGVVIVVGAALWALSWAVTPDADLRHWRTLPGSIHLLRATVAPGHHTVTLDYFDAAGTCLPERRQVWHHVPVNADRDTLLLLRSLPGPAATATLAPGAAATP